MRWKITLLCLTLFSGCSPAIAESLSVNRFGGLNTDDDPLLLPQDRTPDSESVLTDEAFGLSPRPGFSQFSTETASGLWVFPVSNGNRYIITQSSNVLKATLGGTNFTVIIGTVDTSVRTAATALGDRFVWASKDGMKSWNTSVVLATNPTYDFTNLVAHKGRCWGAGLTGDKRTIYVSKYLDCTEFALAVDPVDTDPTRIQVQGALDENIAGLFSSFNDYLMWSKASSFGGISGSRRSQFASRVFSDNVGSAYPESFQDCDGKLRFLGTKRTVWEWDGSNLVSLTNNKERINTLMQTVTQGDANSRNWTQTSQADWQAGILGIDLSATASAGSIVHQSRVGLNETFEPGTWRYTGCCAPQDTVWEINGGSFAVVSNSLVNGSGFSSGLMRKNFNASGGATYYMNSDFIFNYPSYAPDNGIYFYFGDFNGHYLKISSGNPSGTILYNLVDDSPFSSIFSSQVHSSLATNPTKIIHDPAGFIHVFRGSTTLLGITAVPYTETSVVGFRYISTTTRLYDLTANTRDIFNSTFTSQIFSVGDDITSWGAFTAGESLNDGSIAYTLYSGTNAVIVTTAAHTYTAKQEISNGDTPTLATGTYIIVLATFTRTASTQTPTLNDFTLNWDEGFTAQRVASLWIDQRYHLGVAISSTGNNIDLVYDRNSQWQKWRGINMSATAIINSDPYFGNSGGIWELGTANTDAGTAITAYYKTKRLYPSGPNYSSFYDDIYMTTANSGDTLQTQYYVDGVNSPFSMANYTMNTSGGMQDVRLPFTTTMLQQGKTIEFLWTVSGTTNWRILNANLNFTKEPALSGN